MSGDGERGRTRPAAYRARTEAPERQPSAALVPLLPERAPPRGQTAAPQPPLRVSCTQNCGGKINQEKFKITFQSVSPSTFPLARLHRLLWRLAGLQAPSAYSFPSGVW